MKRASSKVLSLLPLFAQISLGRRFPFFASFLFRAMSTYVLKPSVSGTTIKLKTKTQKLYEKLLKKGLPKGYFVSIAGEELTPSSTPGELDNADMYEYGLWCEQQARQEDNPESKETEEKAKREELETERPSL